VMPSMQAHVLAVQDCIENHLHIAMSSITESDAVSATTTTTTPEAERAPTSPPASTPTRNIDFELNPVHSQGRHFEFNIPNTHVIVHKNCSSQLENERDMLNRMRNKAQQKQCKTESTHSQTLWSTALASVPALALSAVQFLMPLLFWAFLQETGLFNCKRFDRELCARSFPSDNTLRKCSLLAAARETMWLGHELRGSKTHMACDKGNKKGTGHLVKCITRWTPAG